MNEKVAFIFKLGFVYVWFRFGLGLVLILFVFCSFLFYVLLFPFNRYIRLGNMPILHLKQI